jgi:hypothetical protein
MRNDVWQKEPQQKVGEIGFISSLDYNSIPPFKKNIKTTYNAKPL